MREQWNICSMKAEGGAIGKEGSQLGGERQDDTYVSKCHNKTPLLCMLTFKTQWQIKK